MVHFPSSTQPAAERGHDRGHFNQYGMRDDARDPHIVDGENAADGRNAQRFGGSGDASTYGNRVVTASAHAAAVPPSPTLAVNAGGSSRALGLDYGGERQRGRPLSSRQGAALFNEWADRKR